MTTKQIEDKAVAAITDFFCDCTYLSPYVNNNDKEPCWDGSIFAYDSCNHTVNNLIGRLPVQIKGKVVKTEPKMERIKYPVRVADLHAYRNDGGVVFFVVYIYKDIKTIYYKKLAPIDLYRITKASTCQQTIQIEFDSLTKKSDSIDFEFINFYTNCKKQKGIEEQSVFLKDLTDKKESISFKFFATSLDPESIDIPHFLIHNKVYLYVEVNNDLNLKGLIPIGDGEMKLNPIEKVNEPISVKGTVFFTSYTREYNEDKTIIKFGGCCSLQIMNDNNSNEAKLSFVEHARKLSSWINEAKFVMAMSNSRELTIGNKSIPLGKSNDKKILTYYNKWLPFWKKVEKVLEVLHCNIDLDINNIKSDEMYMLKLLISAFYDKKEVSITQSLPPLFTVNISNICLGLSAEIVPSGKYLLRNFNCLNRAIYYTDNSTEKPLETCVYSWLQKDGFLKVSNIDYSEILSAYQRVAKRNPILPERANNDLLMMLLAYDEDKNPKTLDSAYQICSWLISDYPEELVYKLNLIQIKKRMNNMTSKDKEELMSIIDETESYDVKLACYLLLGSKDFALFAYSKLKDSDKTFFKSLPIAFFGKDFL